ncbi:hypothetical protein CWM47_36875 [Spirosoma pollinicola]|uniref:Uncharacterized protein n=1 Tax=Spirosoma pollinicola TaxID=2057025 RepID=A0A2K8ZAT6_9BACT|nr:hypothetical protein CWM47_36875 [Spirosoma pollinicola]
MEGDDESADDPPPWPRVQIGLNRPETPKNGVSKKKLAKGMRGSEPANRHFLKRIFFRQPVNPSTMRMQWVSDYKIIS